MNECNEEFLRRNGISIEDICSSIDCHVYSSMEVNPIIASYGFKTNSESEMISIADIVGYDTEDRQSNTNIFLSMDYFFKEQGKGYHTRSLGMLKYDKENILENLKQSFINEPISLIETGEGTYTVLSNGLHRYTLLRILYLSEVAKAGGNKEALKELRSKYKIPANVTGIDLDKTYCKYLLTKVKAEDDEWKILDIKSEVDANNNLTGNAIIKHANGEDEIVNNELLLLLTKERIAEDETFKENYPRLQHAYNKYPSFALFMEAEFPEITQNFKREKDEKGLSDND